jgi:hypothetical protein
MIDVKLIRIITGEEIIAEVLEETVRKIQRLLFRKHTLYTWQKFKKMLLKNTMKCLVAN